MKKTTILLLSIFVMTVLLFNACKKSDDSTPAPSPGNAGTGCMPIKFNRSGDTTLFGYEWNSNGKLSKQILYGDGKIIMWFNFVYNGSTITLKPNVDSIVDGNSKDYFDTDILTLDSRGYVVKTISLTPKISVFSNDTSYYTYNADGNIASKTTKYGTTTFTFSNDNLTQMMSSSETTSYEYYTDKVNNNPVTGDAYSTFIGVSGNLGLKGKGSKNLIKKAISSSGGTTEYSYEFDSKGNIIKETHNTTSNGNTKTKVYYFVYDCK